MHWSLPSSEPFCRCKFENPIPNIDCEEKIFVNILDMFCDFHLQRSLFSAMFTSWNKNMKAKNIFLYFLSPFRSGWDILGTYAWQSFLELSEFSISWKKKYKKIQMILFTHLFSTYYLVFFTSWHIYLTIKIFSRDELILLVYCVGRQKVKQKPYDIVQTFYSTKSKNENHFNLIKSSDFNLHFKQNSCLSFFEYTKR
jgi:hypothetical protein